MDWRHTLFHNWHLKLFSLLLAAGLWAAVATEPTSEISFPVPLEYQNIPAHTEVFGDPTTRVEVRLRGPSSFVKELSPQDVSLAIDVGSLPVGSEKILSLTPEQIRAPFGIEVVRVIPARVRMTVEATVSKTVPIVPISTGSPAKGFEVGTILLSRETVDVEGPASHVGLLESAATTPIDLGGKNATFTQTVDLDIPDPLIRVPDHGSVRVEVEIRAK